MRYASGGCLRYLIERLSDGKIASGETELGKKLWLAGCKGGVYGCQPDKRDPSGRPLDWQNKKEEKTL